MPGNVHNQILPFIDGQVIARARVEHRGRTTCLVSITVDDGAGTVYASGRFPFFCTGTL